MTNSEGYSRVETGSGSFSVPSGLSQGFSQMPLGKRAQLTRVGISLSLGTGAWAWLQV